MSNSGNIAAWGIGDYGEIGNSGFHHSIIRYTQVKKAAKIISLK